MQPQRQTNPWMIVLGICGGCLFLALLGIGGCAYMAMQAAKPIINTISSMGDTIKNSQNFLTYLQAHNYSAAEQLLNPACQSKLPADKLKALTENIEKQLGPIQQWDQETNDSEKSDNNTKSDNSTNIVESYTVHCKNGDAIATFTFYFPFPSSTNAPPPDTRITDFTLKPAPKEEKPKPKSSESSDKDNSDTKKLRMQIIHN